MTTYKENSQKEITKILAVNVSRTIAPYAGGVDEFTYTHGLGYIPPIKVFFSADNLPKRILPTPYSWFSPAFFSSSSPFTITYSIDSQKINFGMTNRDTSDRTVKLYIFIYAERSTASQ